MNKDQGLGVVILIASILGILVYGGLVFFAGLVISIWVLRITAFIAVAGVLAILAWIGYTLATTPPPQPIEELEKELQMSSATQSTAAESAATDASGPTQTQTQASEQLVSEQKQSSEDDKTKEQKSKTKAKKTE